MTAPARTPITAADVARGDVLDDGTVVLNVWQSPTGLVVLDVGNRRRWQLWPTHPLQVLR